MHIQCFMMVKLVKTREICMLELNSLISIITDLTTLNLLNTTPPDHPPNTQQPPTNSISTEPAQPLTSQQLPTINVSTRLHMTTSTHQPPSITPTTQAPPTGQPTFMLHTCVTSKTHANTTDQLPTTLHTHLLSEMPKTTATSLIFLESTSETLHTTHTFVPFTDDEHVANNHILIITLATISLTFLLFVVIAPIIVFRLKKRWQTRMCIDLNEPPPHLIQSMTTKWYLWKMFRAANLVIFVNQ